MTLTAGDRVSLLTAVPGGTPSRPQVKDSRVQPASEVNGDHG